MDKKTFERLLEVERGVIDLETGLFPMILATDGESDDGHIVNVRTTKIDGDLPLLFNHRSTIDVPVLGHISDPIVGERAGIPILQATGHLNLEGDDPLAGVRRGFGNLIHSGDLRSISYRWASTDFRPRTGLPRDHQHHVPITERSPRARGMFMNTSQGMEGSVVAMGSDPKALMSRSEAAEDEITKVFFRVLAQSPQVQEGTVDTGPAFAALASAVSELDKIDIDSADMLRMLEADADEAIIRVTHDGKTHAIPVTLYEHLRSASEQTMREAFEVLREAPAGVPRQQEAPRGDDRILERKPTVNDMSPEQFQRGLTEAMTKAMFQITGRG